MFNKKHWKKNLFTLTCLTILASGISGYFYLHKISFKRGQTEEKTVYSSEDQRFQAQFPSEPKNISEEMDIANQKIQYNEVRSEENEVLYAVSYIDFPGYWKWLGTEKLLTKSFEMFVENEKGVEEVLQQELMTHQGEPALAYRLKQEGKEIYGKFVVSGNTLYRIAVTYPLAAVEQAHPETFLDSFQLKS